MFNKEQKKLLNLEMYVLSRTLMNKWESQLNYPEYLDKDKNLNLNVSTKETEVTEDENSYESLDDKEQVYDNQKIEYNQKTRNKEEQIQQRRLEPGLSYVYQDEKTRKSRKKSTNISKQI